MCPHGHSVCFMSPIHRMAYKGNLPFSLLSRSQLPWQASESKAVLILILKKKKKRKFCAIFLQRACGVYLFYDRFLFLGRKMLLCLEWMLTPPFHRSSLFFFCMGDGLRGRGDKTAKEIFLLQSFTSACLSEIQSFHLWACFPPTNSTMNSWYCTSDSPSLPFQPPQLQTCDYAGCFLLCFGLQRASWKINSY